LLVPVFAAYLLYDFDRIIRGVRDLVPLRYRGYVVEVARDVDVVLGEFVRGQLIVMMILAVLYATAYMILGVRLGVLIGVVAGLLSFIPYVGGGVAVGLGVAMSLVYWTGWGQLVGVVVAYSIIQALEGLVITPRVVGDKVGLSAVWVLFALLVGGELFGFMGVLLALPAAAVIKIFVMRGLTWYRASEMFLGHGDAHPDPAPQQAPREDPPPAPAVAAVEPAKAEPAAAFERPAAKAEPVEAFAAQVTKVERAATFVAQVTKVEPVVAFAAQVTKVERAATFEPPATTVTPTAKAEPAAMAEPAAQPEPLTEDPDDPQ
jgi:hypothetical protein